MPYDPLPDLATMSLADIAAAVEARRLPPVERWNPSQVADSHMRIAADGTWFHEGRPITRPAMVRAFASLLTRDADGRHWLVTPECKQAIEVDDAAFQAVELKVEGGPGEKALAFRLNTDELVVAGAEHPLRAAGDPDVPALYLAVRRGCEARLNRSTYLQLVEHALSNSAGGELSVSSRGTTFSLVPA
ncbi:DUF1285 domain-containing protein [Tsuneonella sp. HG222]